jgi:hypothetical protein
MGSSPEPPQRGSRLDGSESSNFLAGRCCYFIEGEFNGSARSVGNIARPKPQGAMLILLERSLAPSLQKLRSSLPSHPALNRARSSRAKLRVPDSWRLN